ncbi:MAG: hypothetical protein NVSMB33_10940 [Ktedonobacteraceae bacterium]
MNVHNTDLPDACDVIVVAGNDLHIIWEPRETVDYLMKDTIISVSVDFVVHVQGTNFNP